MDDKDATIEQWLEDIRASWHTRLEDLYGVCEVCGGLLDIDGNCSQIHGYDGLYIED